MSNIFQFKPSPRRQPNSNVSDFIEQSRDKLTVFGEDLNWSRHVWEGIAVFSKLGVTTRKPLKHEVMDEAFIDFAKAYLRYQQGHKPTRARQEMKALRAVEATLLQVNGSAQITGLSFRVLDMAAQKAREHYGAGGAYQGGRELARLAEFVTKKKLIAGSVNSWKSPFKRPEDKNRTGKKGKADIESKLPDDRALNALADIFALNPHYNRDIFTTSTAAMLMSAPSRVSEVMALPENCEFPDKDKKGKNTYGWRFFSGKGGEGDIKWIPTEMVPIAKTALDRIRQLSSSAREFAKWVEEHPDEFFRHPECPSVPADMPLTMEQACQALGLASDDPKVCRRGLTSRKLAAKDGIHTLNSLWRHLKDRLPDRFPWLDKERGVKFSDALFVFNKNQFHATRRQLPCEIQGVDANFFNNDLSPRAALKKGTHRSIFARHGYFGDNGEQLKITSHQFRHLLNTIAQRGGLSNLEIAKWSGRADVRQNRAYNHMTEYEMVGLAEKIDPTKSMFGPTGGLPVNPPVSSQEFNTLETAAAHVTEYGYCVHDYTMSPCEKYRDCVNCTEQVCVKGDTEKLERIKARLDRTEVLLKKAQKAMDEGDMGADRWYQYHNKTVKRLRELVVILTDPDLEDGAQVKLRGNDFSQLRRVTQKKALAAAESYSDDADVLEDMRKMMGGGLG